MGLVWDGFRMDVRSFDEAMDMVDAFRPTARTMLQEWNARLLASAATALIDGAVVRGAARPSRPLSQAWSDIQDRRLSIIRTERRDPVVDPEFRLTLVRHEGHVYGLDHCEHADWRNAWRSTPGVHDFAWGDHERPDDVPRAEWRLRERAWKAMIPDAWPAGHGIVVVLTPRYFDSTPEEILAVVPSMADRILRSATDLALSARIAQTRGTPSDASTLARAASKAASWITSDMAMKERDRIAAGLTLPTIDLDTLLGFDPEKHSAQGREEPR